MKAFLAGLLLLAALSTACDSGSDGPPTATPQATATSEAPAQPPQGPTEAPTDQPGTMPTPPAGIAPTNIGSLQQVAAASAGEPVATVVWRSDEEAVYVATQQSVAVLERQSDALTTELQVAQPASILDVSPLGVAAVRVNDTTISLREAGSGAEQHSLDIGATITSARFSPDGTLLAVTQADQVLTQIWDAQSGEKVEDLTGFETEAPAYGADFGSGGRSIIWHARERAQVFDLVTGELGPLFTASEFIGDLAISPVEHALFAAAGARIEVWDLQVGATLDTIELPEPPLAIDFSPDGQLLALANNSGVGLLEMPLGDPAGSIADGTAMQEAIFSPRGDALVTVSREGDIAVWAP